MDTRPGKDSPNSRELPPELLSFWEQLHQPMAVAMFDWICQIDPVPVDALKQKYKCLALLGEIEKVKAEATKKSFTTCMEAASTIAARHALSG